MVDFESRAPAGYKCPICAGLHNEQEHTYITLDDIVYADDLATALINSFFMRGNEGHVIVVPNAHYENIYDLPQEELHRISEIAQMVARAMKLAYQADGINLRQNNEPAAGQHAFHYHHHVIPRYTDDNLNGQGEEARYLAPADERAEYARKLRIQITGQDSEPVGREYLKS